VRSPGGTSARRTPSMITSAGRAPGTTPRLRHARLSPSARRPGTGTSGLHAERTAGQARATSRPATRLLVDSGHPLVHCVWLHCRRRRGLRADLMDRFADTMAETAKRRESRPAQ
jgi:hypothetical protein